MNAVLYKLYQNQSENTPRSGKWYARVATQSVVETNELAEVIQRNCTVKKSDVVAVLTELVEVMTDQLQSGNRVKLNGFGSFKLGISSVGATSAKAFSVSKNIKGVHVLFQPEVHRTKAGTTKTFLTGCTLKEAGTYAVDKTAEADGEAGNGDNGSDEPQNP